jgi:hypothetical protein
VIDAYVQTSGVPPLKYLLRHIAKRLSSRSFYNLLRLIIPPAFEVKKAIHRMPVVGRAEDVRLWFEEAGLVEF